jgi:hypothetical protein
MKKKANIITSNNQQRRISIESNEEINVKMKVSEMYQKLIEMKYENKANENE